MLDTRASFLSKLMESLRWCLGLCVFLTFTACAVRSTNPTVSELLRPALPFTSPFGSRFSLLPIKLRRRLGMRLGLDGLPGAVTGRARGSGLVRLCATACSRSLELEARRRAPFKERWSS